MFLDFLSSLKEGDSRPRGQGLLLHRALPRGSRLGFRVRPPRGSYAVRTAARNPPGLTHSPQSLSPASPAVLKTSIADSLDRSTPCISGLIAGALRRFFGKILPLILGGALCLLAVLPTKSYADAGGSQFLIFGNYDFVTVNTGPTTSSPRAMTWPSAFQDGYGFGLGYMWWLGQNWAVRLGGEGNFYGGNQATYALESFPLTGGIEYKLSSGFSTFWYAVIDAGWSFELSLPGASGPTFGKTGNLTGWSTYFDGGIGYNLENLFLEVKYAYLLDPIPQAAGQRPFWYLPATFGISF